MKKITAIITGFAVLAALFTGCGKAANAGANATAAVETKAQEGTTAAPATQAATTAAKTTEAAAAAETTAASEKPAFDETPVFEGVNVNLHPIVIRHSEGAQYADNTHFYSVTGEYLELNEEESQKYPYLAQALSEDYNNYARTRLAEFIEQFKEVSKELKIEWGGEDYYDQKVAIVRMDEQVTSLISTTYSYLGGAHGSVTTATFNYDMSKLGNIELKSLVKDEAKLKEVLIDRLKKDYPENEYFNLEADISSYKVDNYPGADWAFTWAYDYDGIIFLFDQDMLAPHACGAQTIKLRFEDYPDVVVNKHGTEPERIARPVDYVDDMEFAGHTISWHPHANEYGQYDSIEVIVDKTAVKLPVKYANKLESYLVKADNKLFFYVFSHGDDDEDLFTSFEYADGKAELKYELTGGVILESAQAEPLVGDESYHVYARDNSYAYLLDPTEVTVSHHSQGYSKLTIDAGGSLSVSKGK